MKYVFSIVGVAICFCAIFCFQGKGGDVVVDTEYVRIHIVANSSETLDAEAEYLVKDAVIEFLIPLLCEAESRDEALEIVNENMNKISEVAKNALASLSLEYETNVSVVDEFVPMRAYENIILSEGEYTTLKIVLGSGEGSNWWCVVFPAVCFLDTSNPENYQYVSKIWEIIQSVLG